MTGRADRGTVTVAGQTYNIRPLALEGGGWACSQVDSGGQVYRVPYGGAPFASAERAIESVTRLVTKWGVRPVRNSEMCLRYWRAFRPAR